MKTDRLLGILTVLLRQDKTTARELAEKFEVSKRTIVRDVQALCLAGFPVLTEQGAGGGISLMEGFTLDRTLLTAKELRAVLTGLKSLDSVSGDNKYRTLMQKLGASAPETLAAGSTFSSISLPIINSRSRPKFLSCRRRWKIRIGCAFPI